MTEEFIIGCPKCSSTQITTNKKGFSGGKALTGAILTGGIGLLAGLHGKNKIIITCLNCGNTFKPGDGKKIYQNRTDKSYSLEKNEIPFVSSLETGEINRIVCSACNTENFLSHKYCKNCGQNLKDNDNRIHSKNETKLIACPSCKKLTPKDAKFCPQCSNKVDLKKNTGCAGVLACLIFLTIAIFLLR